MHTPTRAHTAQGEKGGSSETRAARDFLSRGPFLPQSGSARPGSRHRKPSPLARLARPAAATRDQAFPYTRVSCLRRAAAPGPDRAAAAAFSGAFLFLLPLLFARIDRRASYKYARITGQISSIEEIGRRSTAERFRPDSSRDSTEELSSFLNMRASQAKFIQSKKSAVAPLPKDSTETLPRESLESFPNLARIIGQGPMIVTKCRRSGTSGGIHRRRSFR